LKDAVAQRGNDSRQAPGGQGGPAWRPFRAGRGRYR